MKSCLDGLGLDFPHKHSSKKVARYLTQCKYFTQRTKQAFFFFLGFGFQKCPVTG